ncbi:glycosyltransferase [Eubacterium limosum]|uniref:glycosyltransferase n=1 Tax=Eubacterium limosum TaxID=1736 RepID=UPI00106245C9|nr:glycosyltransferase [Eubacterium limosum]
MNISVVVATYNGEKFLESQLDSIFSQIEENDECIITDDGSVDNTIPIIKKYIKKYGKKNIILVNGKGKGFVKNFENGINYCNNEIIVFSDQDDIWEDSKIETIKEVFAFHPEYEVVLHNAKVINESGITIMDSYWEDRNARHGIIKNIIKSSYTGCCMAVKKEFVNTLIPFNKYTISHDMCIGIISEKRKSAYFLDKKLISYRKHSSNYSQKLKVISKIKVRLRLLQFYLTEVRNEQK